MKTRTKLLALAGICISASLLPIAGFAATIGINIIDYAFVPANPTISIGDTVTWTQQDPTFHTTSSGPVDMPDGIWDSGLLGQSAEFSFTFANPGSYPYYCQPHSPSMLGTVTVAAASNAPPMVVITNPVSGATFTAPASVTIQATASDSDGFITGVEFFDGTNSLGLSMMAPYSVVANLSVGSHALTAVASDDGGISTTSAVVNVTVVTVPITDPIPEHITKGDLTIELQTIVDGLSSPVSMTVPDDGTGRIFICDQIGLVWQLKNGVKSTTPLLDVRSRLVTLGSYEERGLLGLAVHPQFALHPFIYTYTSEPLAGPADFTASAPLSGTNHQSVVTEWQIDPANTNRVDPASRRELMRIDEPQSNHNGGTLRFGPDGFLYISFGDGGAADDQGIGHSATGNGQDTNNIYGTIARIDVNGTNSVNGKYGVPLDNPFVGGPGVDEIFAYGFRNPYSYSFDRLTGQLYAGDVGQNKIEEVDIVIKGGNYGWNLKEGTFYFDPNGSGAGYVTSVPVRPVPPDLIDPIAQYDHDEGLAIVGGYVYRGTQIPALQGRYITGDWGDFSNPSGRLFYLTSSNTFSQFRIGLEDRPLGFWLKGFGEDASGEVYLFVSRIVGPGGNTGRMLKIVPAPAMVNITSATANGANVTVAWTGGSGPFALQKKTAVTDATWLNANFTALQNTTVANDGKNGILRVVDTSHALAIPLTASLSGAAERPTPLVNGATGSGTFSLEGTSLTFSIRYSGLSGTATASHIHGAGSAAQAAPVIVDLSPYNGGAYSSNGTLSGTIVLTPAQLAMVLAGQTYVNFHTTANPGGEMRGQIAPVLMQATLNGAKERPTPVISSGTGSGTFMLAGNQLTLNVTYRGLSGTATAAHIHGPATTEQATGVLIDLSPFNGGAFGAAGSLSGTVTLTAAQLASVVDGLTYVNIHTPANGGGEIRGQIVPQTTAVPLTAALSGLAERPTPLTNSAVGSGTFSLEGSTLTFNVRYSGLSGTATAAHIHGAATAAQSAGVLVDLSPYNGGAYGASGTVSGSITLTAQQKTLALAGQLYVNFHTAANPGGELRGQIVPVLLRAPLSGTTEKPNAIATLGTGVSILTLVGNQVSFNINYSGLTGTASAAHLHGPATSGQTASVLVDLSPFNGGAFGAAGNFAGTVALTFPQLASFIDGLIYVNVHTAANGGGEIRGQVTR